MAALGAWLQLMQQLPEPVLAHFRSGLKEKEGLRRAHLRCLVQVCRVWFVGARPIPARLLVLLKTLPLALGRQINNLTAVQSLLCNQGFEVANIVDYQTAHSACRSCRLRRNW